MEKMTQKELKRLVKVGYSSGVYGCNGMLLRGKSGQLYAVCARTTAIYIF